MTELIFKKKNRSTIKPGDLFSFRLDNGDFDVAQIAGSFGFGRIVSQTNLGHIAEIYRYFAFEPNLDSSKTYERFKPLVVLDAYSLFQRKSEGDWGVVGSTPNYVPDLEATQTRFAWGLQGSQKVTGTNEETIDVSDSEADKHPRYQPWGDYDIKQYITRQLRAQN
jgi:hypothetical protein